MSDSFLDRDEIGEHVTSDMIVAALALVEADGGIDGAHHKQWVIDQMLRLMLGDALYARWRDRYDADAKATGYTTWDEGIAP